MFEWLKSVWWRLKRILTPKGIIEKEFQVSSAVSEAMEDNISLWYNMYVNTPPWETCDVQSLGLPGAIAREFVRSALTEFDVVVSGSQRGEYINEQMQKAVYFAIPCALELGLALGGAALKPLLDGNNLTVDITAPMSFTPTEFDVSGKAVGGVFRDVTKANKQQYVRLEYHGFRYQNDGSKVYVIQNVAFASDGNGMPSGDRVSLSVVPAWSSLPEEIRIANLEGPLFAYFKRPVENGVDFGSDVGVSIYSGAAVGLIRQADEQWGRLMWEYESGERKIFVDGIASSASQFKSRLFEFGRFGGANAASDGFFEVFSPDMRDDPLYNGFQRILQRVEFETGLAFGDISDPQSVEKTATEIRSSKQRKYVSVTSIQKALQEALDGLIYAINAYCDIYQIVPSGDYEAVYTWGDSVLDDPEAKRQDKAIDLQEVAAGLLNDWEYRVKWFGESEDEAKAMLPKMEDMTTESQDVIE